MQLKFKAAIMLIAIIFISPLLSLAETINYTYDSLNRIVREERSNGAVIVYAYDSAGNRTSKVVSGSPVTTTTTIAVDTDNDGIPDSQDNCPNKPNGPNLGTCSSTSDKPGGNCTSDADCATGCSSNGLCIKDQRDADNDGIGDICDCAPDDATKFKIWTVYVDADNDGHGAGTTVTICGGSTVPAGYSTSNDDGCPDDPLKTAPGICGCGISDTDSDSDGLADCNDNCPNNCNVQQLDADGDGIGDVCDPDPGCGGCTGIQCEQQC